MRDEERFYKREEDLRRIQAIEDRVHKLEASVVSLTTAQVASTDDINELANAVEGLNELLHGDVRSTDSGMVGQVNDQETKLNGVLRILHGGLLDQNNEMWDVYTGTKQDRKAFWENVVKVLIAVIGAIGGIVLLFEKWPDIREKWDKENAKQRIVHRQMERAKTRRRTIVIEKVVPAQPEQTQSDAMP